MSPVYADPTWWQRLPECLAQGRDAVLVTVARVAGSTPRDIGATVLVEAEDCTDTVGGGNLEFEAIATARRMKDDGHTGKDIAKYLGVSRATLYRYLVA